MAIIIPAAIIELVAVPKLEIRLTGIVSSSIFGPATEKTPQHIPNRYLPTQIIGRFKNIVRVVAIAENTLKTIIDLLLPKVMNLPPSRLPVTTPKIAELLIMVL
jgi:hypothetical protein